MGWIRDSKKTPLAGKAAVEINMKGQKWLKLTISERACGMSGRLFTVAQPPLSLLVVFLLRNFLEEAPSKSVKEVPGRCIGCPSKM